MDKKTKEFNRVARKVLCEERREEGIWSRPANYPEYHLLGTADFIVPSVRDKRF